jgi:hypothetical protein
MFYRPFFISLKFNAISFQSNKNNLLSSALVALRFRIQKNFYLLILRVRKTISFVDYRPIFLETSCQPQNGVTRLYNLSRSYSNDFPGKRRIFTNSFNSLLHFSIVAAVRRVGKRVTSLMT